MARVKLDQAEVDRRERFVDAYLTDKTAKGAAILAGYPSHEAEQTGVRLLRLKGIAATIKRRKKEAIAQAEMSPERIIGELKTIVMFDPRTILDDSPSGGIDVIPPSQWPDGAGKAISSVECVMGRRPTLKIKFVDRMTAIAELNRMAGNHATARMQAIRDRAKQPILPPPEGPVGTLVLPAPTTLEAWGKMAAEYYGERQKNDAAIEVPVNRDSEN